MKSSKLDSFKQFSLDKQQTEKVQGGLNWGKIADMCSGAGFTLEFMQPQQPQFTNQFSIIPQNEGDHSVLCILLVDEWN